jgi:ABC-type branched-subunit amino acid transport system permease subunit
MPRQRTHFALIAAAAFLAACAPTGLHAPAAPTPASGIYDGNWEAHGTSADGQEVSLTLTISDSAVTWMTYTYAGQAGETCYFFIEPGSLPRIVDGRFAVKVPTVSIDGEFDSPTSAAGHISFVEVQGARRINCVASIDAKWVAARKQETPAVAPAAVSWCGKNVDCRDLLLQLLIFGLVNGAILALNAIGVTLIYSTVRTINLAHGDVFALTTVLITSSINLLHLNTDWPAGTRWLTLAGILLGAILFGALLSLGVEQAAFRPFRGRSRLAPVIASLGISFILYQGSLIWRAYQGSFIRGEHRSVPGLAEVPTDGIPNFLPAGNLLHGRVVLQFSDVFVWAAAILFVAVATYILARTRLGRSIRAVAQNEELAQMVGVDRDGAVRWAFALGGALAGAAGFVFALYYSRPFGQAGAESGLFAFAAALLGGIGSPVGALFSGLLLGVTGSLSDYFLRAQWTPVLVLGLLSALLVWRRGGLAGAADADETTVRDSVVLTAANGTPRLKRWLILAFMAFALLPILSQAFNLGGQILLRGAGIFILLTLGLNILLGLAGVLDLGYAMSYAVGAYTAAILTARFGAFDFTLVLLASAGAAAFFGLLKGWLAGRMRGDYLAVGTLVLGLMTQRLIVNLDVTHGPNGFSNLPPPRLFGFSLGTPSAEYYLVYVFVLFAALLCLRLTASRTGRAWLASSEDETAAISFGVNTARYRLLAFVISSGLAGLAGALYASTLTYIDPDIAAFHVSAMMLAMVILGGAGSVTGAILGALLIYGYDKLIIPQLAALVALLWPQGLYLGMVPDIRGTNFFNFGIALYLTVLWRARRK